MFKKLYLAQILIITIIVILALKCTTSVKLNLGADTPHGHETAECDEHWMSWNSWNFFKTGGGVLSFAFA